MSEGETTKLYLDELLMVVCFFCHRDWERVQQDQESIARNEMLHQLIREHPSFRMLKKAVDEGPGSEVVEVN